ncbi:MAG: hypothetical protein K2F87_06075 [Muribaculaceae bacterium]|nr:hypothetical protein [Muribaculaceae bacterium]
MPPPVPEPEPEPEPVIPPAPDPVDVEPLLIVIDKEGTPVPSFPIDFTMPDGSRIHTFTGGAGEYRLPVMQEGEVFSVTDGFSGHSESFMIEADKDKYYFRLDYVPTMQDWDITIKVIDEKGKPVYPGKLSLTQRGDTLLSDLPQDATIGLSKGSLKNDVPITVKLVDGGQREYNSTDFKLVEGETEYVIQLDTAPCPAWKRVLEVLSVVGVAIGAVWCYPYLWDVMKDLVLKTY